MGRVARYKKVKSFDPYSKKNRGNIDLDGIGVWGLGDNGRKAKKTSRRAEHLRRQRKGGDKSKAGRQTQGFDLPPEGGDDFDLKDILGTVKKQKPKPAKELLSSQHDVKAAASATSSKPDLNDCLPKTEQEERRIARMLKLDEKNVEKEMEKARLKDRYERKPGESRKQYDRRTKQETQQLIMKGETEVRNPDKKKRKKEFLKQKKAKKRKGNKTHTNDDNDDDDFDRRVAPGDDDHDNGSSFITGERAIAAMKDQVQFGEQALQPPVFRQLPRGATAKTQTPATANQGSKKAKMTDAKVKAEQQTMQIMRQRVQQQYAQIKAKRKQDGEFHL